MSNIFIYVLYALSIFKVYCIFKVHIQVMKETCVKNILKVYYYV